MRQGLRLLVALVPLLVALAPAAAAQQSAPVLVERADEESLVADVGNPAEATFALFNLNPTDDFFVSVNVDGREGWTWEATPNRFFLQPRNETLVQVAFLPEEPPETAAEFDVTFSLVHGRTGEVTQVTQTVEVASGAAPRILGFVPNPLGPPLDNAWGTFLLEMALWSVTAVVAIFAGDAIVRAVTARASNAVTREILTKLRKPIFYFVLLLGLARSLSLLPGNPVLDFLERTLVAIAVVVFGLFVLYKALDAALFYYQQVVAPRTNTKVDDVLVPVLRKVGIVVLYAVGVIATLRRLGWDPTIVFAGAGIAGLVIAFAAQDTFSNLFSGLFILLDQPFKEGDDIQLETGELVRVENVGLRTTRLYHPKTHESITVPNNQLATRRVINLSGPDKRYWVMIDAGVAYGTDPAKVRTVLLEVALRHPEVTNDEGWQPLVLFNRFGESSLDFILRFGVKDYRQRFAVASDIRFEIEKAFRAEGIEIPFPQRTLWIKEMPPRSLREPAGAGERSRGRRFAP